MQKEQKNFDWLMGVGLFSLVAGIVALVAWLGSQAMTKAGEVGNQVLFSLFLGLPILLLTGAGLIAAVVCIVINIVQVTKKRGKLGQSFWLAVAGGVLALMPAVARMETLVAKQKQVYEATAGVVTLPGSCRVLTENGADFDVETHAGEINHQNAVVCAYLKYVQKEGEEPQGQSDLLKYLPAGFNCQGGSCVVYTIDAEQPKKEGVYNIVTRHSCNYAEKQGDEYVSVWHRTERGMACASMVVWDESGYRNLYEPGSWYSGSKAEY